ncbi:MAG: hypothetical protein JWR08_2141 [Enterovirga sp.]|nr:hypothetical protein [Enterovirga sp.]
MTDALFSRRALLGGAAALAVAAIHPARAQPGPQGPATFSGIVVDVRPLRYGGPAVEAIRQALHAELTREYADRLGGRGPQLVVRITGLSLSAYSGPEARRGGWGGGGSTDYLEGEALVIGRRGEVLARHPQLSALSANSGGPWYDPASEGRRIGALAAHFAGWLKRSPI